MAGLSSAHVRGRDGVVSVPGVVEERGARGLRCPGLAMEASAVREHRRRGIRGYENGGKKRNGIVHGGLGNGKGNQGQREEHPGTQETSSPGSGDERDGKELSVLQEELRVKEGEIHQLERENETLRMSESSQREERDSELQGLLREERVSRIKLEEEKRRLEKEVQELKSVSEPSPHKELDLHSLGSPEVNLISKDGGEPLEWREQHRRLLLEVAQLKEQLRTVQQKWEQEQKEGKDLLAGKASNERPAVWGNKGTVLSSWEAEHSAARAAPTCAACEVHQDEIQSLKEIMALDVQALKQHQKKIEKLQDKNKKHLEILKLKEEEIERLQNKVDAIQKVRKDEFALLQRQIQKCNVLMKKLST